MKSPDLWKPAHFFGWLGKRDLIGLGKAVAHEALPAALPLDGEQLPGVHDAVELPVTSDENYSLNVFHTFPMALSTEAFVSYR